MGRIRRSQGPRSGRCAREPFGVGRSGLRALAGCSLAGVLGLLLGTPGNAAPPVVSGMDIRGLSIGTPTTVTITGTALLPNPRLLGSVPILRQRVIEGAKPERVSIEVELAGGAQPGLESVWLVSEGGVSGRSVVAVDALPQRVLGSKVEGVPAALHGSVAGAQSAEVKFAGKAAQELWVEVEAQRLDSRLRPVLRVSAPDGALLGWSLPMNELRGDTRLKVRLPADGEYRVEVRDLLYAAAAPSHFRLRLGAGGFVDGAFPAVVEAGSPAKVELVSREGTVGSVAFPAATRGRAVTAAWPAGVPASGPRAAVWLSPLRQTLEAREAHAIQPVPGPPFSVNGRISAPGEADRYEFAVEPNQEIEFELLADSLGSPVDGELELLNEKGVRLAVNDDGAGTPDARLVFKVPEGVGKLVAVVRDVSGRGGPNHVYCLQARRKGGAVQGRFSLRLSEDSLTVPQEGGAVLRVEALREGYDGPIALEADRLPEGFEFLGAEIPAGATGVLAVVRKRADAAPGVVSVRGKAAGMETVARVEAVPGGKLPPWLEDAFAVSGNGVEGGSFQAAWEGNAAGVRLPVSGKATVKVRCVRAPGQDGPVRLTLLTSQARQMDAKGAIQAVKMLREEKAVLVEEDKKAQAAFDALGAAEKALQAAVAAVDAAAKKGEVPEALHKAVEAAGEKQVKAREETQKAAAAAKNDAEVVLLVPPDLQEVAHQVSFKAELLKRDRKTVEAVAYLPVVNLPVVNPIGIQVPREVSAVVDAKKGGVLEIKGEVERLEDGKGEVTLSLAGLPAGLAAAAVTVKAGEKQFLFKIQIPASFKPGEFGGVKLSATGKPFGSTQIKTQDIPLTVKVLSAEGASEKTSG